MIFNDDNIITNTSIQQRGVEVQLQKIYAEPDGKSKYAFGVDAN